MSSLVERLREEQEWQGECFREGRPYTNCVGYLERAANEIERLKRENEYLRGLDKAATETIRHAEEIIAGLRAEKEALSLHKGGRDGD